MSVIKKLQLLFLALILNILVALATISLLLSLLFVHSSSNSTRLIVLVASLIYSLISLVEIFIARREIKKLKY